MAEANGDTTTSRSPLLDLPIELLSQVLSNVPCGDLHRSVMVACRRLNDAYHYRQRSCLTGSVWTSISPYMANGEKAKTGRYQLSIEWDWLYHRIMGHLFGLHAAFERYDWHEVPFRPYEVTFHGNWIVDEMAASGCVEIYKHNVFTPDEPFLKFWAIGNPVLAAHSTRYAPVVCFDHIDADGLIVYFRRGSNSHMLCRYSLSDKSEIWQSSYQPGPPSSRWRSLQSLSRYGTIILWEEGNRITVFDYVSGNLQRTFTEPAILSSRGFVWRTLVRRYLWIQPQSGVLSYYLVSLVNEEPGSCQVGVRLYNTDGSWSKVCQCQLPFGKALNPSRTMIIADDFIILGVRTITNNGDSSTTRLIPVRLSLTPSQDAALGQNASAQPAISVDIQEPVAQLSLNTGESDLVEYVYGLKFLTILNYAKFPRDFQMILLHRNPNQNGDLSLLWSRNLKGYDKPSYNRQALDGLRLDHQFLFVGVEPLGDDDDLARLLGRTFRRLVFMYF